MTTITIPADEDPRVINGQTVYTKVNWSDSWTEQSAVVCTSANWSAAPTIPQASFYYRYGVGSVNNTAVNVHAAFTLPTYGYVKVVFNAYNIELAPAADGYVTELIWYGVVVSKSDLPEGDDVTFSDVDRVSGTQAFFAVGFEYLLDRKYCLGGKAKEEDQTAETIFETPAFNFRGEANRTETGVDAANSHGDVSSAFFIPMRSTGTPTEVADYWSTADVIKYLMCHLTPLASDNSLALPFRLFDTDTALPTWDRPEFDPTGQRLLVILNSLIPRQRGLSYRFDVLEVVDGIDVIRLIPFSLREADATAGSLGTWSANADLIDLDLRHVAGVEIQDDGHNKFDRVRVIGGKVIYCFTVIAPTFEEEDSYSAIDGGWSQEQEDDYTEGLAAHADYADWDAEKKVAIDSLNLASPHIAEVFTRYKLKRDFAPTTYQFPALDNLATTDYVSNSVDMRYWFQRPLLPYTPINPGVDYKAIDAKFDWDKPRESLLPFASHTIEGSTLAFDMRYGGLAAGVSSKAADQLAFTCNVVADGQPLGFELFINGALPHRVGFEVPFEIVDLGDGPGKTIERLTIAIEGDRFTESVKNTGATVDAVREKVIDVGDRFRCIVMLAYTIFAIKKNTTSGSDPTDYDYTTATKLIRDDRPYLESIATAAMEWYSVDRRAMSWTMRVPTTSLFVGQLIENIQVTASTTEVINTTITSIQMQVNVGSIGQEPVTSFQFATQFSELDFG